MIEAEIHARVRERDAVLSTLRKHTEGEESVYYDRYFDWPDGSLMTAGYEIRTRIVETAGHTRSLLTVKEPPVEDVTRSKPEHETSVGDPAVVETLLTHLGLAEQVAFTKHCVNFSVDYAVDSAVDHERRQIRTTLVNVPELDGDFIEAEIQVAEIADVEPALAVIRAFLASLGIAEDEYTTDTYTAAVSSRRSRH